MPLTYEQRLAFVADQQNRTVAADPGRDQVLVIDQRRAIDRGPAGRDDELIVGPCDAVLDFVAWRLQHDKCTPQYEHMLWSVSDVQRSADEKTGAVRMTRSRYAGD